MSPSTKLISLAAPALCATSLLAGCSDQKLGTFNGSPEAAVLSPTDGAEVEEGAAVELRGSASDPDDAAAELLATWFLGFDEACAAAAPVADGTTTCTVTPPAGTWEARLEVRDPDDAAASDAITFTVAPTAAPTATIEAPTAADVLSADVAVHLRGLAADEEDAATTLSTTWSSDVDGPLSVTPAPDADGVVEGDVFLTAGPHVLTFTVTDSDGKVGTDTVGVEVRAANTAPTCALTSPLDGDVFRGDEAVRFTGTTGDADQGADSLAVVFADSVDGELGRTFPTSAGDISLVVAALSAGAHHVTMTVTDDRGATCTDAVDLVVGAPPDVVILAPTDGDVVGEGVSLTFEAQVGDDQDAPEALALSWESDRDGVLSTAPADGAGLAAFATDTLSAGDHLVTLTVTDADGMTRSANVAFTVNGAPTAPIVTLSPDPAASDDDLNVSVGVPSIDPEGDTVSYRYAWFVDGVASGASTSARLPASATSRGETWTVRVTPTDGISDGPYAEDSVTIDNGVPSVGSVRISPDPATASDTLTCSWSGWSDPDGDTDASTLAWTVDGRVVGTSATLSTGFARGDTVTCTVTPWDGREAGTAVAASLTIDNAPPEATRVAITPTTPTTNSTASASATGSDPDGDTVTWRYDWYVNGAFVASATSLSGSTAFDKGDELQVVATPSDGTTSGTPVSSSVVTALNTAPGAPTVSVEPADAIEGDVLVCVVDTASTDADRDSVTYSMEWLVDGVPFVPADMSEAPDTTTWVDDTIPAGVVLAGETWTCTATPNDGESDGATASASVTVGSADIDYSGTWTLDSRVNYRCAYGLVSFDFTTMTVTDASPTVSVRVGGNPGTMTGTFTDADSIDVDNVLTGSCTETYAVVGDFVDANTFEGTFSATYTYRSNPAQCADCVSGDWFFTATR